MSTVSSSRRSSEAPEASTARSKGSAGVDAAAAAQQAAGTATPNADPWGVMQLLAHVRHAVLQAVSITGDVDGTVEKILSMLRDLELRDPRFPRYRLVKALRVEVKAAVGPAIEAAVRRLKRAGGAQGLVDADIAPALRELRSSSEVAALAREMEARITTAVTRVLHSRFQRGEGGEPAGESAAAASVVASEAAEGASTRSVGAASPRDSPSPAPSQRTGVSSEVATIVTDVHNAGEHGEPAVARRPSGGTSPTRMTVLGSDTSKRGARWTASRSAASAGRGLGSVRAPEGAGDVWDVEFAAEDLALSDRASHDSDGGDVDDRASDGVLSFSSFNSLPPFDTIVPLAGQLSNGSTVDERMEGMNGLRQFSPGDLLASEHWIALRSALAKALEDDSAVIQEKTVELIWELFRDASPVSPVQTGEICQVMVSHLLVRHAAHCVRTAATARRSDGSGRHGGGTGAGSTSPSEARSGRHTIEFSASYCTGRAVVGWESVALDTASPAAALVLRKFRLLVKMLGEMPRHWIHFPDSLYDRIVIGTCMLLRARPAPSTVSALGAKEWAMSAFDCISVVDAGASWFGKWVMLARPREQLTRYLRQSGLLQDLVLMSWSAAMRREVSYAGDTSSSATSGARSERDGLIGRLDAATATLLSSVAMLGQVVRYAEGRECLPIMLPSAGHRAGLPAADAARVARSDGVADLSSNNRVRSMVELGPDVLVASVGGAASGALRFSRGDTVSPGVVAEDGEVALITLQSTLALFSRLLTMWFADARTQSHAANMLHMPPISRAAAHDLIVTASDALTAVAEAGYSSTSGRPLLSQKVVLDLVGPLQGLCRPSASGGASPLGGGGLRRALCLKAALCIGGVLDALLDTASGRDALLWQWARRASVLPTDTERSVRRARNVAVRAVHAREETPAPQWAGVDEVSSPMLAIAAFAASLFDGAGSRRASSPPGLPSLPLAVVERYLHVMSRVLRTAGGQWLLRSQALIPRAAALLRQLEVAISEGAGAHGSSDTEAHKSWRDILACFLLDTVTTPAVAWELHEQGVLHPCVRCLERRFLAAPVHERWRRDVALVVANISLIPDGARLLADSGVLLQALRFVWALLESGDLPLVLSSPFDHSVAVTNAMQPLSTFMLCTDAATEVLDLREDVPDDDMSPVLDVLLRRQPRSMLSKFLQLVALPDSSSRAARIHSFDECHLVGLLVLSVASGSLDTSAALDAAWGVRARLLRLQAVEQAAPPPPAPDSGGASRAAKTPRASRESAGTPKRSGKVLPAADRFKAESRAAEDGGGSAASDARADAVEGRSSRVHGGGNSDWEIDTDSDASSDEATLVVGDHPERVPSLTHTTVTSCSVMRARVLTWSLLCLAGPSERAGPLLSRPPVEDLPCDVPSVPATEDALVQWHMAGVKAPELVRTHQVDAVAAAVAGVALDGGAEGAVEAHLPRRGRDEAKEDAPATEFAMGESTVALQRLVREDRGASPPGDVASLFHRHLAADVPIDGAGIDVDERHQFGNVCISLYASLAVMLSGGTNGDAAKLADTSRRRWSLAPGRTSDAVRSSAGASVAKAAASEGGHASPVSATESVSKFEVSCLSRLARYGASLVALYPSIPLSAHVRCFDAPVAAASKQQSPGSTRARPWHTTLHAQAAATPAEVAVAATQLQVLRSRVGPPVDGAHFDWFTAAVTLLLGRADVVIAFLRGVKSEPSLRRVLPHVWVSFGRKSFALAQQKRARRSGSGAGGDGGGAETQVETVMPPLLATVHLIEALVRLDSPAVAAAFDSAGVSLCQATRTWITQCFLGQLDLPDIARYLLTCLLNGPQYQVFFVVALVRSMTVGLLHAARSRDLHGRLLLEPLPALNWAALVTHMDTLAASYGNFVKSFLEEVCPDEKVSGTRR